MENEKKDSAVVNSMQKPQDIEVKTPGFEYILLTYEVTDNGISSDLDRTILKFCRGSKNDSAIPRQAGVFVESLLTGIIHRLKTVNVGDLATRETAVAITKLEEALMWIEKRSNDRKLRGVEGTYQK